MLFLALYTCVFREIIFESLRSVGETTHQEIYTHRSNHQEVYPESRAASGVQITTTIPLRILFWYVANFVNSFLPCLVPAHDNIHFASSFLLLSNFTLAAANVHITEQCLLPIDRLPLYPESNSVPRFGAGGKAGAAQMRGKPPGL